VADRIDKTEFETEPVCFRFGVDGDLSVMLKKSVSQTSLERERVCARPREGEKEREETDKRSVDLNKTQIDKPCKCTQIKQRIHTTECNQVEKE